jgi:xylan 1,4-beta-xylosidase
MHRIPSPSIAIGLIIATFAVQGQNRPQFTSLPVTEVTIDLKQSQGPLELWRHTLGVGGINPKPLPPDVVAGAAKLKPRLVRIFIQEFFSVYPEAGRFDWSRLDPYMDALDKTGAKVVAAITIKPKPLYPKIDQSIWMPNDVAQWQRVISELVKRYSLDKPVVTYWEIGNETDIGENGGCPYLIKDVKDYVEYYRMTIEPIVKTFPKAKVGGTAVASAGSDYLPSFIKVCADAKIRLDFVSWHRYDDDPRQHARLVTRYRKLLDEKFPGRRPEMLVTEWSKGFEPVSVEEQAFDSRRAAITAASIIDMTDAGVDWTFYYHLNDQTAYWADFEPFFANPRIMYHHWDETPHRFGLFGVNGEVRPQYFVYQMLSRMPATRVRATWKDDGLRVLASTDDKRTAALLVNFALAGSADRVAALRFAGLTGGAKTLRTWRIDQTRPWDTKTLELRPLEQREVDVRPEFALQLHCPADSVLMVVLEDAN